MFRHGYPLAFLLAAAAVGCGDQRAYPIVRPSGSTVECPDSLVGYAAVNATNGGSSSALGPATVTTAAEFVREATTSDAPNLIYVDGMIALTETVEVASNKTITGLGANSGFTGAGLHLDQVRNIILKNLVFSKIGIGEGDAINLKEATDVWIDHCDFSSDPAVTTAGYDGLVELTHASDWVTVSWNRFHDHRDTGLIGNLEDNAIEDMGKLHATYHRNLFLKVNSGPRVRYGTVHVFSNHFQEVAVNGVAAETMSAVYVDQNVFDRVATPITTDYDDLLPGSAREVSNRFVASGPNNITATANPIVWPYAHTPDSAASVPAIVAACAGTGKIPQ